MTQEKRKKTEFGNLMLRRGYNLSEEAMAQNIMLGKGTPKRASLLDLIALRVENPEEDVLWENTLVSGDYLNQFKGINAGQETIFQVAKLNKPHYKEIKAEDNIKAGSKDLCEERKIKGYNPILKTLEPQENIVGIYRLLGELTNEATAKQYFKAIQKRNIRTKEALEIMNPLQSGYTNDLSGLLQLKGTGPEPGRFYVFQN